MHPELLFLIGNVIEDLKERQIHLPFTGLFVLLGIIRAVLIRRPFSGMAADARRLKNGAEPFPASRGENAGSESGCDRNAAQEHDRVVRFEIGLRQFSPIDFHPVSFRRDGIPVRCEMQAVPPGEGRAGISGLPDKPVAEKQQNRGEKRKNRRDGARQRVCREEARDDERSNQEHD